MANTLSGIGNAYIHQEIISDLIFETRKKFENEKGFENLISLPEISISELGCNKDDFLHDYNLDFVIYNKKSKLIKLIVEIVRKKSNQYNTINKLTDFLHNYQHNVECYLITVYEDEPIKINNSIIFDDQLAKNDNNNFSKILKDDLDNFIKQI